MSGRNIFFFAGLVCGAALGSVFVGMATADPSPQRVTAEVQAFIDRLEAVEARVQALAATKPTPKNLVIEADDSITLTTGRASLVMKKSGAVDVSGLDINIKATKTVRLKGKKISEN